MERVRDSDGREDPLGVYVGIWHVLLDVENRDMVYTLKRVEYCIFLDSLDFLLPKHHE